MIKISREQWEPVASVLLRVPGLFILDYWWQHDLGNSLPATINWQNVVTAFSTDIGNILFLLFHVHPMSIVFLIVCLELGKEGRNCVL